MNLKEIGREINELLEKRRQELNLSFVEEDHIYYMKDLQGNVRTDFPSVSTVLKSFYTPFDAEGKSLEMCNGNFIDAELLREQWKGTADYATNMGSRVHFELEKETINRNGGYKEVRQPIFKCDDEQLSVSDQMIKAGEDFLDLMESRGAVLLDTEIVLGDNEFGYTGQPDKVWLMFNKKRDGFGFCITDWKTNKPKNFEIHHYTVDMLKPFNDFPDTALSHYFVQLPLYGKLIIKMLQGTKYADLRMLGGVVVLLRSDGSFLEYRIPQTIVNTVLNLDIKKYI